MERLFPLISPTIRSDFEILSSELGHDLGSPPHGVIAQMAEIPSFRMVPIRTAELRVISHRTVDYIDALGFHEIVVPHIGYYHSIIPTLLEAFLEAVRWIVTTYSFKEPPDQFTLAIFYFLDAFQFAVRRAVYIDLLMFFSDFAELDMIYAALRKDSV